MSKIDPSNLYNPKQEPEVSFPRHPESISVMEPDKREKTRAPLWLLILVAILSGLVVITTVAMTTVLLKSVFSCVLDQEDNKAHLMSLGR